MCCFVSNGKLNNFTNNSFLPVSPANPPSKKSPQISDVKHVSIVAQASVKHTTPAHHRNIGKLIDTDRELFRNCLLYTSPSPRDRG